MSQEYINHRDVENAEELADAIAVLVGDSGRHPSTINCTVPIRITLVEEKLSDGSTVHNLQLSAPRELRAPVAPRSLSVFEDVRASRNRKPHG